MSPVQVQSICESVAFWNQNVLLPLRAQPLPPELQKLVDKFDHLAHAAVYLIEHRMCDHFMVAVEEMKQVIEAMYEKILKEEV